MRASETLANGPAGYWFKSPLFGVEPGEDRETNPGRYGRQLAHWLAERLRARGHQVEQVTPEDWGWRVTCLFSGDRFIVGCGNVDEAGPEEAPSAPSAEITWHAFPAASSSRLRRWRAYRSTPPDRRNARMAPSSPRSNQAPCGRQTSITTPETFAKFRRFITSPQAGQAR